MRMGHDKLEKVVIAIPESVSGQSFVGSSLPPLGQIRMAGMIKNKYSDVEVEVLDGAMIGQENIKQIVSELPENSLLGLSAHTSLNWGNCLDLVGSAPSKYIVIGGIHAYGDRCGKMVVRDRGLDVIQGVGEFGLLDYVEFVQGRKAKEDVENLIYLKDGEVRENGLKKHSQEEFDFADYGQFVDVGEYAKNFKRLFGGGNVGFTMVSPEGCRWQDMTKVKKAYCLFCDIGTDYFLHKPEFFGRWVADHVERYGDFGKVFMINYADEASGAGLDYWKSILENMPSGIKPHEDYGLKFYTKSGRSFFNSDELARVYRDLGVEDIHVGFEAATDEDLKSMHKGVRMGSNYELVDLVDKYGFRMIASFVLGAPSASKKSLEGCVDFMEGVRDKLGDRLAVVTGSPLMPLPGSPAWEMLRDKAYSEELFDTDNPDLHKARELWYEKVCDGVDLDYVNSVCDKLNSMGSLPTPDNHYG